MDQQSVVISEKAEQAHRPGNNGAGPSSQRFAEHPSDTLARPREPPPYSGPSNSAADPRRPTVTKGPQHYPGLPILDYRQYSPEMFELSTDSTTITSKASYLSENAKALSSLVRTLATVPPKPQIHIRGSRGRRVDFHVRLNLMNLLVPDDPRHRMDYLRCVAKDEMAYRGGNEPSLKPEIGAGEEEGLEAWCQRFVKDQSSVKIFTLERVVANLDHNWLEGQVRSLIASVNYKGNVTVQFPVTHARAIVQNPDKVNKFFTSVTTLFSGKAKYEVVKAVWPFANARNGEHGRKCIVQSEKVWWDEWRDPIKYAIIQKRQGWVTNEDKLECIMESKGKNASLVDWGPDEEY
ncbi:hypothetical protein F5B22DRAFT_642743 [Xylaria bambusicola]|uniref:uncharacterized protein n=1 Tax=Xylaria bambusicola TaxID=326684 RepID=UPI002007DC7F|nr:uncharacterized protein F5B22DRAFT_642743 [Xylaria bambusicola]KAI0523638.1 hypothetical protein F5B22DRAFT_642743 [Xylaria bambusicola]